MVRSSSLAAVSLFLLAASSVAAQVADDKLVVPGKRIGKWTLEMTVSQMVQLNGPEGAGGRKPANLEDLVADLRLSWWPQLGLVVAAQRDQRIILLAVSEFSAYATDKAISATKPEEAVATAYGIPERTSVQQTVLRTLIYDKIGLAVLLDSHRLVRTIYVFRTGEAARIWKK